MGRSSEHADPSTEHRTEAEIPTDMSKSVPVGSGRVKQDRKMGQPADQIKKTVNFEQDMGDTAGQVAVKVRNVEKAKVRVSQSARKKEDDTTEAEPQARFGARRAPPSQEALQNMMLGSDVRDNNIEVAPPQAIPRVAESKVRFNLHRARTMEDKTTEVAPPQSEAKARFRAAAKKAHSVVRRAPLSQQALQSMKLDSEMRDNNIEVAPPPAIQRIAEANPRFGLHRARTMEEFTTAVGS